MAAVYAIDLIAIRDKKRKMDSSIVKGWNVHYQTLEEVEELERLKKQKEKTSRRQPAMMKRTKILMKITGEIKSLITKRPVPIPGFMVKSR